jgi:hypothetical protein
MMPESHIPEGDIVVNWMFPIMKTAMDTEHASIETHIPVTGLDTSAHRGLVARGGKYQAGKNLP